MRIKGLAIINLRILLLVVFALLAFDGIGQTLSGYVYDSDNQPVPFADVYFKFSGNGTKTDVHGKYTQQFQDPTVVEIVIKATGFKTQEHKVVFEGKDIVKNFWLQTDAKELEELLVESKRRDPAYGIIAAAINNKSRWKKQYNSSTCEVYLKASEILSEKEKKRRKREAEEAEKAEENKTESETDIDVFEKEAQERKAAIYKIASGMNMMEIQMTRHYQYPNQVKEIRDAKKQYGWSRGLYYTNTAEVSFNFYENLMNIHDLNELPLISPLHATSVVTYKFKLEETTILNGKMLYKIKVTPRKKGNASWAGHIWILDDLFCIVKVDLSLNGLGLYVYDKFNIQQEFEFFDDSTTVLKQERFDYESKGSSRDFKGQTVVQYSDYILNPEFDKRFFRNELAVTTQEAYDRDSTYWDGIRPEPLTKEEQRYQFIKDSIYAITHSEHYLDSLDSVYNVITALDVLWDGMYFSNRNKKIYWGVSSLAGTFDPFEIGGIRVGPDASFFKKWENEKYIWTYGSLNFGIRNPDPRYMFRVNGRYDAKHQGYAGLYIGDQHNMIVENDAISPALDRKNWIREQEFEFFHSREIVNGLYVSIEPQFQKRSPITDMEFNPMLDSFQGNNTPVEFEAYDEFIFEVGISYTPFQKYMTEPNRKVVLGSKWPTFSLYYEKGIEHIFGSEVDFDYLSLQVRQSFKLGTLGTSSYLIRRGEFLRNVKSSYADQVIFPQGDQWLLASSMQSMQSQDTMLIAEKSYTRAHYMHHFNGAIVNNIPFVKKLGLHMAAGASTLFIEKSGAMKQDYFYWEVMAGVERTFKVQRSRIRIGAYLVEAYSNRGKIAPRVKFAINRYSVKDQKLDLLK